MPVYDYFEIPNTYRTKYLQKLDIKLLSFEILFSLYFDRYFQYPKLNVFVNTLKYR